MTSFWQPHSSLPPVGVHAELEIQCGSAAGIHPQLPNHHWFRPLPGDIWSQILPFVIDLWWEFPPQKRSFVEGHPKREGCIIHLNIKKIIGSEDCSSVTYDVTIPPWDLKKYMCDNESDKISSIFLDLFSWWSFYGFYHGIHHHFSPPFGEYVWNFFQASYANLRYPWDPGDWYIDLHCQEIFHLDHAMTCKDYANLSISYCWWLKSCTTWDGAETLWIMG